MLEDRNLHRDRTGVKKRDSEKGARVEGKLARVMGVRACRGAGKGRGAGSG